MKDFRLDARFAGVEPFGSRLWLSSPTMHGEEQYWVDEAIRTNWVSTVGANIQEVERLAAETVGRKYAIGLSAGTAALHLAVKLAGERLYGQPSVGHGTLEGRKVFASDMTFDATVNPVAYEGGETVFIDAERDTWNMDPAALEKAFDLYPDVRLVIVAHLYGVPAKIGEIRTIADRHGALVVEDAAESFLATCQGRQTGAFGDISILSFNGNKLITGSAGGMLLTDDPEWAAKTRKWSTQSREDAPWYQHEELGYNYRMSNIVAGVVRGQFSHAAEHRDQKKAIYFRYKEGLKDLPVSMNPFLPGSNPNFWLSCILVDSAAMAFHARGDKDVRYASESGKSSPSEILDALASFNAEGRPIWKPMHLQPLYRSNPFVSCAAGADVGGDIFQRGLCLPSDNKMSPDQQARVIDIVRRCFR